MKRPNTLAKIISMTLVLSILLLTFASCAMFKGSLKLESFTVDRSSVKTAYFLGDEIDFSGIRATVKYSDASLNTELTFDDLTITYDKEITATVGQKPVKVSFQDPHLNVEQSTTVQITVSEDPNAVKHDSYVADATAMKTTYLIGDTIDFTGIKIIEKFTNGGADVEMTDLSKLTYDYSADITATPGIKTVLVKYDGEDAGAVSITVNRPAINEAVLDTTGVTLNYLVGDTVSFDGLKATITYENGKTATITTFTFKTDLATLTNTVGDKNVIVEMVDELSGTTRQATFTVKVDGIVDYTVDTSAMELSCLENEVIDFSKIKVTATYYYGKTELVDFSALAFVHEDNLTATTGSKTVTVKVGESEVGSFIVSVGDIPTATANTENVDLSYRVGETVSLEGLTVTLKFTDGTADQVVALADLVVETALEGLTATAGTKTINVKYQFDAYFIYAELTITVYGIDHYEVDASEMLVKEYIAGNRVVDFTGVKVYAVYLDGGEKALVDASRVTFDAEGVTATAGVKEIPVLVDGASANATVSINVIMNSAQSVVVGGTFDNKYKLNETTDFSGITVTVTYLDGTEEVITDLAKLTFANNKTNDVDVTTVKTVEVSLLDKNNDTVSATFQMVVAVNATVSAFEQNENINAFNTDNAAAGNTAYGAAGFSGEFAVGGQTYMIGDDNEFRYLPTLAVDKDGQDNYLNNYFADIEIEANGTKLDKAPVANSVTNYNYTLNGELYATVDTYNGKYQFARAIDSVKITVKPSAEYYTVPDDITAVTLNAKVIDGYNVYEAWQLSVIDNATYRSDWDVIKTEKGILGLVPSGVILHNDIKVTYEDVPSSFFYQSSDEVQYVNKETGEIKIYKESAGMNYLKDSTYLYIRTGSADLNFQGNFFHIDLNDFPIVASPSIFGADNKMDYGSDYSNAALFLFETLSEDYNFVQDKPADVLDVTMSNVSLKGNAGRDQWQIQKVHGDEINTLEPELVTAGGLIFVKTLRFATSALDNVNNNCFYISYMPAYKGNIDLTNVKCYDSYQNAAFVWGDSTFDVNNSFINGTGGPIVISQSIKPDGGDVYYDPTTNINNTIMETHSSGDEVWFQAVGAVAVLPQIKAFGAGLNDMLALASQMAQLPYTLKGNWVDANGKMNIKAALMNNADSAAAALTDINVQGGVYTDGTGIDRWRQPGADWGAIMAAVQQNPAMAACPFITVYDQAGTAYTLYFVQEGTGGMFYDLSNNMAITDSPNAMAICLALATADEVVFHQGGLSILFEFYH